jgi:predicted metalloprotease
VRAPVLLVIIAAALLAGCGGGNDGSTEAPSASPTATATATATPTATATIEPGAIAEMGEVPSGGSLPTPASTKVHDPNLLHAAFASAETMWNHEFASGNTAYQHASLTFFHNTVRTPCGEQSREVGPFYCPPAHAVYLNTAFFDALARQFGLRSGFAAGYIVGHEVAHHVQELLGILARVRATDEADPAGANARSIATELQADCFAGVWLHSVSARGELSSADVDDILRAATVVGDDFQRNQAGADLAPETWTHGSSAQRRQWLSTGIERGSPAACDTFGQG